MKAFCRDCFWIGAEPVRRCPACGTPRVVAHAELARLSIAHMDCDAFYASVEKRDRPELRDVPLIVGGGMSNEDALYARLPAAIAPHVFSDIFETPIRKALHGDSSGVRGAAWLWPA